MQRRQRRQRYRAAHPVRTRQLYRHQVEHELKRELIGPSIIDYLKQGYQDKTVLPNPRCSITQVYLAANALENVGPELSPH